LRDQLLQVEDERLKAAGALCIAMDSYREGVATRDADRIAAACREIPALHARTSQAQGLHHDVSALLPPAEEAARDDLTKRLTEAATAANESARERAEALRRQIAEEIATRIAAIVRQDKLRAALLPANVLARHEKELAGLL
jgi:hypothetical protein